MTERWLTLPLREPIRSAELQKLVESSGRDFVKLWDACAEPRFLVELAAAGGMPVNMVLSAASAACKDAWSHWSAGATDARPLQIVASVDRWVAKTAGFEDIWSTWELAERVRREVRDWHAQQQGAVVANSILSAVDAIHALATAARNLAEPEPGHDQHDPARYQRKNVDPNNAGLVHDAADPVRVATTAGVWFHSHSEPGASAEDHTKYAQQILGFVIRKHLNADDVVQGLRERLR